MMPRSVAVLIGTLLLIIACGGGSGQQGRSSAANNTFPRTVQTCTVAHPQVPFPQLSNPLITSTSFYAEIFPGYHEVAEYGLLLDAAGIGDLTLEQIPESVDYKTVELDFQQDAVYDGHPPGYRQVVNTTCKVNVKIYVRPGAAKQITITLHSGSRQAVYQWEINAHSLQERARSSNGPTKPHLVGPTPFIIRK